MANSTGIQLAQNIRRSVEELKRECEGLDEDTACRAPSGRWSPKEILSHLCGPEGAGQLPMLQAYLEGETPRLDIDPENPFFSEKRRNMTVSQLLAEVEREYGRIAEFVEGLSGEQLDRKAYIPQLKGSPFGEYPTLEKWIGLLGGEKKSHVHFHIDHMHEIRRALGVTQE